MLDNGSAIETANIGSESAGGLCAAMYSDFVTSGPPLVASCHAAYLFLGSASEHDCGVKRGTCLEGHPLAHLELQMAYRGCEHRPASVTFALSRSDPGQIWTGKTNLTIGTAPTKSYLLQEAGSALAPIETPRDVITRLSDQAFKNKITGQTTFRPATAALSKEAAKSSLRAVALDNQRDVAVEVSAASDEDVQQVLRAVAAEIEKEHMEIIKQRLEAVAVEVEDLQGRIGLIEKLLEAISRAPDSVADDKSQRRSPMAMPDVRTWNELKDRIRRGSNLIKFSEPTVFLADPDSYPRAARSIAALRSSILAGLGMLVAMIVLATVVSARPRA